MYVLTSEITIGEHRFESVHEVSVKRSIQTYIDTANIKLPASARLKHRNGAATETVQTAKYFKEGDKVTIKLGYNGQAETEFTGFVSRVNFATPCEVECEGYSWLLRNKDKLYTQCWETASLKEVLQLITKDTGIKLSPDIADTKLSPFGIERLNGAEVLDKLVKEWRLTVYFVHDTLYAGLAETTQADKEVKYKLGYNVLQENELKYRSREAAKVQVNINYKDAKGKTQHKITGEAGGKVINMDYTANYDEAMMLAQADKEASKEAYAGYAGKITAFLVPYAGPGYKAIVTDDTYPERNGGYLLESTEVQFGLQGARRICEIGKLLNQEK